MCGDSSGDNLRLWTSGSAPGGLEQLWEALGELLEGLEELWETLYIDKLLINRNAAIMSLRVVPPFCLPQCPHY